MVIKHRRKFSSLLHVSVSSDSLASQVLLTESKELEVTGPRTVDRTCRWLRQYCLKAVPTLTTVPSSYPVTSTPQALWHVYICSCWHRLPFLYALIDNCRSRGSCGLRRGSAASRSLGPRVRIRRGTWMCASCECCLFQVEVSATGRLFVQRSPTECGASECGLWTSTMRRPSLAPLGLSSLKK
jgi:hypothetical protein